MVVVRGEFYVRSDGVFFQQPVCIVVEAARDEDEVDAVEGLEGEGFFSFQRMSLRQDGEEGVFFQYQPVEAAARLHAHKGEVHRALFESLLESADAALSDVNVDVGIVLLKASNDLRQPVYGDACKGTDAQRAADEAVDGADGLAEALVPLRDLAQKRQDPFALCGKAYAVSSAHEDAEAELLFHSLYHVAYAGLRIAEALARFGEVTAFGGLDDDFVFSGIHMAPPIAVRRYYLLRRLPI